MVFLRNGLKRERARFKAKNYCISVMYTGTRVYKTVGHNVLLGTNVLQKLMAMKGTSFLDMPDCLCTLMQLCACYKYAEAFRKCLIIYLLLVHICLPLLHGAHW